MLSGQMGLPTKIFILLTSKEKHTFLRFKQTDGPSYRVKLYWKGKSLQKNISRLSMIAAEEIHLNTFKQKYILESIIDRSFV